MVGEISQTVKQLALAGLKARYPNESSEKIRRRLATVLLGSELADKVYCPLNATE
jgi:hypothetical protein